MTSVNAQYKTFAENMRAITGLGAAEMGSAPDERHLAGGGYHVGVEDIQRIGRWNTDYSTRQARDRRDGTNESSAFDIGDDWPRGGRPAWLRFNAAFLRQLQARDPALTAVRAINFSPDGTLCRRFDTFNRGDGVIASTDSVYMHTHGETWRDQAGTPALDRAFRRVEQMADAAIRNVPLPPEGDDMDLDDDGPKALVPGATNRAVLRAMFGGILTVMTGERRDDLIKWSAKDMPNNLGPLLTAVRAQASSNGAGLTEVKAALATLSTGGVDLDVLADKVAVRLGGQISALQQQLGQLARVLAAAGGSLEGADDSPAAPNAQQG